MNFLLFPLVLVGAFLIYFISVFNAFSKFKVRIKEAWSQIDVQLKRRVDLVPNLVEAVKGYAEHEKEVFDSVTKARSALMTAQTAGQASHAEGSLSSALKSLFAVAEAYPELKAQEGFVNLQKELALTEDKIAYSRQFYNTVVRDFNQMVVSFPSNIIAGMFGFKEEEFFELADEQRQPVKVAF